MAERRVAVVTLLLLAGLGVLAAPATATFHLNKVNEVMLIRSGARAAAAAEEVRAAAATVNVALGDGSLSPSPKQTGDPRVRFRVRNRGVVGHEMVVIRTRRRASRLPVKGSRASERGRVGKIRTFSPGRTRTLSLRLKRGHYALICNIPGHYQGGVRADFRVR